jgi:sugar (pentulose or hexulose) kinase
VRHCLESAGLTAGAQVLLSGGGVRSAQWRQILADVLQRPLALARQPEVGARGAAMAALTADNRHYDVEEWTRPDAIVAPRTRLASLYDEGFAFYRDRLEVARGHWSGPIYSPR